MWFDHVADLSVTNPFEACRPHVDMFLRRLEELDYARSTIHHYLSIVRSFDKYAWTEDFAQQDPAAHVPRPKYNEEQVIRPNLEQLEMHQYLKAAAASPDERDLALVCLVGLNGLRISEALGARIETLGYEAGHHTLKIVGKNTNLATIALAHPTHRPLWASKVRVKKAPVVVVRGGHEDDDPGKRRGTNLHGDMVPGGWGLR